jgi:hypothetical protein
MGAASFVQPSITKAGLMANNRIALISNDTANATSARVVLE